jgi:hypothetical protein
MAALCTVVGVPEIAQLALSMESPVGRVGEEVQVVRVVPVRVGVMVVMTASLLRL